MCSLTCHWAVLAKTSKICPKLYTRHFQEKQRFIILVERAEVRIGAVFTLRPFVGDSCTVLLWPFSSGSDPYPQTRGASICPWIFRWEVGERKGGHPCVLTPQDHSLIAAKGDGAFSHWRDLVTSGEPRPTDSPPHSPHGAIRTQFSADRPIGLLDARRGRGTPQCPLAGAAMERGKSSL